jgi:hypothetical protein
MTRAMIVLALLAAVAAYVYARVSHVGTRQELLAQSDFVGLIRPRFNDPAKDVFTPVVDGGHKVIYHGVDTRFRVDLVFKSDGKAPDELTVLHFTKEGAELVANGPLFIYFPEGPFKYEKRIVGNDGRELGKMTYSYGDKPDGPPPDGPLFLAFLKHRSDGRYEPVGGQEDAYESFYEVDRSLLEVR